MMKKTDEENIRKSIQEYFNEAQNIEDLVQIYKIIIQESKEQYLLWLSNHK